MKFFTRLAGFIIGTGAVIVPTYFLIHDRPRNPDSNIPTIKNVLVKDPTALVDHTQYNLANLPSVTMTTSLPVQQANTFMQMELTVETSKSDLAVTGNIAWSADQGTIPDIGTYLTLQYISAQEKNVTFLLKWIKAINFDTTDSVINGKNIQLQFALDENPDGTYEKQITVQQPTNVNLAIDTENSYQEDAVLQYSSLGTNQTQYIYFSSSDPSIFLSPNFSVYFRSQFETYGTSHPISTLSSYFGNAPLSFSWEDRASGIGKVELAPGGNITLDEANNTFAIGATYTFAHDSVGHPTGSVDTGLIVDEAVVRGISILRNTFVDEWSVTSGYTDLELGAGGRGNGHYTVTLSTDVHNPVIDSTTIADPVLVLPADWATKYVQYFSTTGTYVPTLSITKTSNVIWHLSVTLTALQTGYSNEIIGDDSFVIGVSVQPTEQSSPIVKNQTITFGRTTVVTITDTATVDLRAIPTAGYVSSSELRYSILNQAETSITLSNWAWSGNATDHTVVAPAWTNSLVEIKSNGSAFSAELTPAASTDNATSYATAYLWFKAMDYTNNSVTIWSPVSKAFRLTPQSSITLTDTTNKFLSYNAVTSQGTGEAGIARFPFSKSNSAQTITTSDIIVTASTAQVTDENVYSDGEYGEDGTIYEDIWSNKLTVEIVGTNIVITLCNVADSGDNPVGPITLSVSLSCTDHFVSANTLTSETGTTQITLQGGATLAGSSTNTNFIYAANGATTSTYNEFTLSLVNMSADQITTSNLAFTHVFAGHSTDTIPGLPSYMNCIKLEGGSPASTTFRIQFIADYKQTQWNANDSADHSNISFSVKFNGTDTVGSPVESNTLSTNATPANALGAAVCESTGAIAWDQSTSTHYDTIAFANPALVSEGDEAHHRKISFNVPETYNFTPTANNVVATLTPATDWASAFIAGQASTDIVNILSVVYESNAWWVKYVYDGTAQHSGTPIAHPTLTGQANATLTLSLYDGATHTAGHLLNVTNPIVIHLAGDSAIDIAGTNAPDTQTLITTTHFDNISTRMPSADTIGAAVWDANPVLQSYLSGYEPNWAIGSITQSGPTYSVDLSTTGIVPGSSLYTFGTVRITFTIVAQDLSYWFGNDNNINWYDDTMYNIGAWATTPTLADITWWFNTHYNGTFNADVFMAYHTTFDNSVLGRITITAQPTSTLFLGSVTFIYTII